MRGVRRAKMFFHRGSVWWVGCRESVVGCRLSGVGSRESVVGSRRRSDLNVPTPTPDPRQPRVDGGVSRTAIQASAASGHTKASGDDGTRWQCRKSFLRIGTSLPHRHEGGRRQRARWWRAQSRRCSCFSSEPSLYAGCPRVRSACASPATALWRCCSFGCDLERLQTDEPVWRSWHVVATFADVMQMTSSPSLKAHQASPLSPECIHSTTFLMVVIGRSPGDGLAS